MPRKATIPNVPAAQRDDLLQRAGELAFGLTRVGTFFDARSEEEAGVWMDRVIDAYGSVLALTVELGWNDAWRQRLNDYVYDKRESFRPALCLHLYRTLYESVYGEPPMLHMVGEGERSLLHRLTYLCTCYWEGTPKRMAESLRGIPYKELPWPVEPDDQALAAAAGALEPNGAGEYDGVAEGCHGDGVVRTVITRSRLHRSIYAGKYANYFPREDILASLVYLGVGQLWLETGVGEPVTEDFSTDSYQRRKTFGDSAMDEYLVDRQERSGAAWERVAEVKPLFAHAVRKFPQSYRGAWYAGGDKDALAERAAIAVTDAEMARKEVDPEQLGAALWAVAEHEGFDGDERRKIVKALGRGVRSLYPEAEQALLARLG